MRTDIVLDQISEFELETLSNNLRPPIVNIPTGELIDTELNTKLQKLVFGKDFEPLNVNFQQEGQEPVDSVEERATNEQGMLQEDFELYVQHISQDSMDISESELYEILTSILLVDPQAAKEYFKELERHFEERVKTDPSREGARPCLQGPVKDAILKDGLAKFVNEMGAVVKELVNQGGLYLRYQDIVIILNKYRGIGNNVGTIYKLRPENVSKDFPKPTKPINVDGANRMLERFINQCRSPIILEPSAEKEEVKQNSTKSEFAFAPESLLLVPALLISMLAMLIKSKSNSRGTATV